MNKKKFLSFIANCLYTCAVSMLYPILLIWVTGTYFKTAKKLRKEEIQKIQSRLSSMRKLMKETDIL